jgi:uncharacterized membrane protein YphA (DoxX/SURF4 family)
MNWLLKLTRVHVALSHLLDHFRSPLLLVTRLYLAWIFWQSGMIIAVVIAAALSVGSFTRIGALLALVALALDPQQLSGVVAPAGPSLLVSQVLLLIMLLTVITCGAGTFSLDSWLERRLARLCRPFVAAPPR